MVGFAIEQQKTTQSEKELKSLTPLWQMLVKRGYDCSNEQKV